MFAVISTSLSATSRSRILAKYASEYLTQLPVEVEYLDLADFPLPACDAGGCYSHPNVQRAASVVEAAAGILVAGPIYNFDFASSTKGLIELTGKAWTEKVVGFLCAAGGQGSYMAPMQMANSLMLDFRSIVLPRFVYATGDQFQGDQISETEIENRIRQQADQLVKITTALSE